MRTTRRGFMGVVAGVAAALGLGKAVAAHTEDGCIGCVYDQQLPVAEHQAALTSATGGNLTTRAADGYQFRWSSQPATKLAEWDKDGNIVYIADELVSDAIAQARAAGEKKAWDDIPTAFREALSTLPEDDRQRAETQLTLKDAVAQIHADGYNRGYAVADARVQSRGEWRWIKSEGAEPRRIWWNTDA